MDAGLTRQLGHGHLPVGLHDHLKKRNCYQFQNETPWKFNLHYFCCAWPAINRQSSIRQELVNIYNETTLWSALLAFLEWNRYKVADSPLLDLAVQLFRNLCTEGNQKGHKKGILLALSLNIFDNLSLRLLRAWRPWKIVQPFFVKLLLCFFVLFSWSLCFLWQSNISLLQCTSFSLAGFDRPMLRKEDHLNLNSNLN